MVNASVSDVSEGENKHGCRPAVRSAWNLFFPKDQNRIRIDGVNLIAESVRPDEIRLRDNNSTDPKPLGYEKWLRRTTDSSVTTNLYPSIIILYLIRIIG